MSKVFRSSVIALCAVAAACADSATNPTLTAPDARPVFNESSADIRGAVTADGPADLVLGSGNASTLQAAAATQAATGGRASGHVSLTLGTGFFTTIATEQYSFTALSTANSPTPFAAKGQYNMRLVTPTGVVQEFHGVIICMGITGNTARIGGQITKLWVNNVQVPIAGPTHNIWVVVDNGQATPDQVSLMQYTIAPGAQAHCATGLPSVVFANQEGEVQVQP